VYIEFFELNEEAFRKTPDPRFLWYSPQHKSAKSLIVYNVKTRSGPVYLYSDVGLGKTSIAKRVREELEGDESKQVVFLAAPNIKTSNAFLRLIMEAFATKTDRSYERNLKIFGEFLVNQCKAGISPVLLVDEAQNMTPDTLKLIHYLFNFSTNTDFLIQVALFGQNELRQRIKDHTSLDSRMTPYKLEPFDLQGTREMMAFRWTIAGGKELPFDAEAITEVFNLTGGNPRLICRLCTATLMQASTDQRKMIDRDTVLAATSLAFAKDDD
jgi:general secretion pathway protein A